MESKRIPDLCLVSLFRQMRLSDQLTLSNTMSSIDSRFSSSVRQANISTGSLTIIIGHPRSDVPVQSDINRFSNASNLSMKLLMDDNGKPLFSNHILTEFNTLYFKSNALNPSRVDQIMNFFPGITSLTFVNRGKSSEYLSFLIMLKDSKWKRQLTELKLFDTYTYQDSSNVSESVFDAINSLPSLKRLAIELNECLILQELSILGQLDEISFNCYDEKNWSSFLGSFLFYGAGNGNLRLDFPESDMIMEKLFFLSYQLRGRVARLSNSYLYGEHYNLPIVCRMFPSLTTLSVDCHPSLYCKLITELSSLAELVHLKIRIDLRGIISGVRETGNEVLVKLNSVKALDLDVTVSAHSHLNWLKIYEVMPSLEAVNLDSLQCIECKTNFSVNFESYFRFQKKELSVRRCINSSLGILKRYDVHFSPRSFQV